MKHFKLNLQAFAEESTTSENETPQVKAEEQSQSNADKIQELKYTDADVDKLINKKFAEWQKKKETEITEAKRLAEMSESEKAEHERGKLQKQLDELLAEKSKSEMTKTARSILSEKGINVSDDLLSLLVNSDAEKTKKAIDSFANLFEKEVQRQVKEALKTPTPRKNTSSGSKVTKEDIMKIKDRKERQRLINENMSLFTGE